MVSRSVLLIRGASLRSEKDCCLVTQSCLTLMTPCTVAHEATLSMRFPRQEHWSGLPFPSPGIELASPALTGEFFTTEPPRKPLRRMVGSKFPSGCVIQDTLKGILT